MTEIRAKAVIAVFGGDDRDAVSGDVGYLLYLLRPSDFVE
jgi:hypothetical protein